MGKSTLYYHEEYVKELESKINDLEKELKRLKENDNLLDRIEELEKESIVIAERIVSTKLIKQILFREKKHVPINMNDSADLFFYGREYLNLN